MFDHALYKCQNEGLLSVAVIIGNGIGDLSSNLDKAVCISLEINAFRKSMNSSVLLAMGK